MDFDVYGSVRAYGANYEAVDQLSKNLKDLRRPVSLVRSQQGGLRQRPPAI
jgi:hypothetical protein